MFNARHIAHAQEMIAAVIVLVALLFILGHWCGCALFREPTMGEAAYTGELLRCVDEASTLAESRECRARVNARWRITETARDAGGDR
jgi:hypothetical protein